MNHRTIKVLLVEDDQDDYVIIRDLLSEIKETEYIIEWVHSYDEAIERMVCREDQVCLLDYQIGPHNGLEVFQRAKENGAHGPVIFVTGREDYRVDLMAMKYGATDYLVKSQLTGTLLDRSIRYAMERWQSEQALRQAYEEMELRVEERTAEIAAANAELKKSSEEIKLFAYSVVHDLKNPIFAIHGLVRRLAEHFRDSPDEKANDYCRRVIDCSEQVVALVDQIYTYISVKECPSVIEKISLNEVLCSVRDEFDSQLTARDIKWNQPDNDPEISADRVALVRIFRNLVENALKYGGDGLGGIWIGYRDDGDHHVISVRDDGGGLQGPDADKIFGVFTRSTNSKGVRGAGLGLAIVKQLARQHCGEAWAEPTSGPGAAFFVSIAKRLQEQ